MTRLKNSLLACAALVAIAAPAQAEPLPQQNDSYFTAAAKHLEEVIARKPIEGKAKNVILFVGDGMSIPTTTATRIYEGQKRGVDGESNLLTVDLFPYIALSKTYSHDGQVSDSAPTATAMVTGVKTKNDIIGLNQNAVYKDCEGSKDKHVTTAFELAEAAGLATGVISTARITHATPAAMYAHVPNRDWENDSEMKDQKGKGCLDIADQLVNWGAGDGFEVALGGGRAQFLPKETADPEDEGKTGARTDGRNLAEEWTKKSNNNVVVFNEEEFKKLDVKSGPKVLGLFERSHMEYEADRAKDKAGEPSLAEMTGFAIDRLSQNDKGFILMVEGGRIDHAHHAGNAARALEDTIAFDAAIKTALEKTKREDTLILVTADHSHSMTINGYPKRGNPILGVAVDVNGEVMKGDDGVPYTTLAYANGPGAVFKPMVEGQTAPEPAGTRPDPSTADPTNVDYLQQALVPMASETHAGDDVAIYAWGPQAHLMQGTVEQNYIYHVIANAMGLNAGM